jgi:autotransporter translocation and assembly factor TamB
VELDRGTFFWRGRSFKINSGKIEFTKENRIEPRFDIWASGEIKAFQVSLNAVGTPGDFVVQLFSNPALPEEDILLLVQFGMTRDELAKTGNAGLLTADVLSQSLGLEQGAKNLFPIIDQFQVTTEFSSNSNQVEPRALVGKNLTEDIKLSAISGMTSSQTLEKGTYFKAMVSYKASKSVNLEASYENENVPGEGATGPSVGNVGVDVKWRLEF